jgi:predicted AAA+ superfamily ATPase
MEDAELLAIAKDWSFWEAPPPASIPRRLALPTELRPDLALVVQGVRRCGKSTLLTQILGRYGLDRRRCLFVNFEDPRLAGRLDHATVEAMAKAFERTVGGEVTLLLDEVQAVDGWQKWLRSCLDKPRGRRFVVTGSNAQLLSGELASSLTGRHVTVELFPFDLAEFRLAQPSATFERWLHDGGFPAPLGRPDGDQLRRAYFNDIVERDVRERVGARSSLPLRQLVQIVYESAGSEMSVRRLAAAIGVSADTAGVYLDAAESAYLVLACPYFAWSERKRAARNRKYYPIDTGLRRVSVTPTGADRGKALECATFLELRRRYGEVFYWRDRGEVDFVVVHEGEPLPVQVSWDGPVERHHKALDSFYEVHPRAREAVFVTARSWEEGLIDLP